LFRNMRMILKLLKKKKNKRLQVSLLNGTTKEQMKLSC